MGSGEDESLLSTVRTKRDRVLSLSSPSVGRDKGPRARQCRLRDYSVSPQLMSFLRSSLNLFTPTDHSSIQRCCRNILPLSIQLSLGITSPPTLTHTYTSHTHTHRYAIANVYMCVRRRTCTDDRCHRRTPYIYFRQTDIPSTQVHTSTQDSRYTNCLCTVTLGSVRHSYGCLQSVWSDRTRAN